MQLANAWIELKKSIAKENFNASFTGYPDQEATNTLQALEAFSAVPLQVLV